MTTLNPTSPPAKQDEPAAHKVDRDYLTPDELKRFKTLSNAKAWLHVIRCYGVIVTLLSLAALFPNPLTIIVVVLFLGGSQLSLGGLLHDCSHRAMFTNPKLNDFVGNWLGGIPVMVPLSFYRQYHFIHHTKTGHDIDPDVGNIKHYPVTQASMKRKLIRDFTGQSGLKALFGVLFYVNTGKAGNSGSMGNNQSQMTRSEQLMYTLKNYSQIALVHGLFIATLVWADAIWLYGLWWAASLFSHPFILRLRQIGEHGAMPMLSDGDVRNTTRSTLASWWEKLLFAPNQINFHCEHHLYPTVPAYNLRALHNTLKQKGFYDDFPQAVEPNYWSVLKRAASKVAA